MMLFPCIVALAFGAGEANLDNLSFANKLQGWEGEGFKVVAATQLDGSKGWAARSGHDNEAQGQTALLHRTITIPKGIRILRFRAKAVRPAGLKPNGDLDVALLASGKRVLPKRVRVGDSWISSRGLSTGEAGTVQEYLWSVGGYEGETLMIVLVDEDARPGCYVMSSGFELAEHDELDEQCFTRSMLKLAKDYQLPPLMRYTSPHFLALSNADETFTENRVRDCELMHAMFYDHFRRKGFTLQPAPGRMTMAIFDTQAGFEAYLNTKMPPLITGLYHTQTNRFIMYDYGSNRAYVAEKQRAEQAGRRIDQYVDRQIYLESLERRAGDFRKDANIGTIMHEVSHQIAFNSGLLNRDADAPVSIIEGLACYCEATSNGSWQGLGANNPERMRVLEQTAAAGGPWLSLRELIANDDWIRGKTDARTVLQGYAQSWALVRMLLEEQPQAVKVYLKLVSTRRTPDHRLTDFRQAFGKDLKELERRHEDYLRGLVQRRTGR